MANEPREHVLPSTIPDCLPTALRAGVESMSGLDLSGVQIHGNSKHPTSVGATPHEAWHVVQRARGRVAPANDVQGALVNDDAMLEREADAMGRRATEADNQR